VTRVQRQRPDGSRTQREIIRHPGSVVLLPCVDEQHVCLIRNYRMAVGQTLVELPAGTLEAGEPPDVCAVRELKEETGYEAGTLTELTSFFAAPGILDEHMHLFLATQLTGGSPQREPDEEIENWVVSWDKALEMIRNGEIRDAKTIVGLLYYTQFHRA
jgi:ADP-ribose pyrophosphatase